MRTYPRVVFLLTLLFASTAYAEPLMPMPHARRQHRVAARVPWTQVSSNPYLRRAMYASVGDVGACLDVEIGGWLINPYADPRVRAYDVEQIRSEIATAREDVDSYLDRTALPEVAIDVVWRMLRDVLEPLDRLACIDKDASEREEGHTALWIAAVERELRAEEARRACAARCAKAKPACSPNECAASERMPCGQ